MKKVKNRYDRSIAAVLSAVLVCTMAWMAPAHSSELDNPETATCIAQAAKAFGIPETPLWVILDVERGQVGKVSRNTNGTYDIGPMQINSIWLPKLARLGISREELLNSRCVNIYVAAWIFTQEYRRFGDLGKAIAHYHSPTAKHQRRYLGLIQKAIDRRISKLTKAKASRNASTTPGPSVAAATLAKPPTITSTSGMK